MVMFTEILRYQIEDDKRRRTPLVDLGIELLEDDYPPVTHVLFDHGGKLRKVKWSDVAKIDARAKLIHIADFDTVREREDEHDLLLGRDLLDALVLDLLGRRTTRICDLWLEYDDGTLRLRGADAGFAALLRRVSRGLVARPKKESLFDWKYVEFLRGDPTAVGSGAGYRLRINRLPAGEIARLADYVPYLHAAELLKLLPDEKAADVLQAMSVERQLQVIEELDEGDAIDLLNRMSPDLATDLVGRLNIDTMRSYIAKLDIDQREKVIELLRYPADSVGGVMINDFIALPSSTKIEDGLGRVQDCIKTTEFVSLVFALDDVQQGKLLGAVSLREFLTADPQQELAEIMDPYLEALDPYQSASDAAHRIVGGQLEAMPVIDTEGRLIGAMTISAAISLVVPTIGGSGRLRVFS